MSATQKSSTNPKPQTPNGDYAQDKGRKQILWLALSLIVLLGLALVILVAYGLEIVTPDYTEPLLLIGLLSLLVSSVAYFADREREHRAANRDLIRQLHETAQALNARVARLNKLCETSTHLAGALDVERVSELVVQALVEQVQADAASLVLLDKSNGKSIHERTMGPLAKSNGDPDDPVAIAKAAAADDPGIHWLNDPAGVTERLDSWGKVRAAIAAPLRVSDAIGGALAAIRQESFSREDLNLLTTLANMASKAIESGDLHEQLRQSYFRTLHVLARSLAARDPYSAVQGEAVTWLACRLAAGLGLGEDVIRALQAYGPLHDLGKIGIPDKVLLKQGPLADEELEMCRRHSVIGEAIIRPLNPGPAVLSMIRGHHKRWDGRGYPDGLKGEHIPLLARIVGVADAFQAMVSDRAYRGGMIPSRAVQEIKALAGAQFDPSIAQALAQLWESGELSKFKIQSTPTKDPEDILSGFLSLAAPPPFPR